MTSHTMPCPDLGALRGWLDRQDETRLTQIDDHVAACRSCQVATAELKAEGSFAERALAGLGPEQLPSTEAVALAHARLLTANAPAGQPAPALAPIVPEKTPMPLALLSPVRRWRISLGGLAAALALTLLVLTPQGQSAAAEFLAQFRSQRFAAISVDPTQRGLDYSVLQRLGTVTGLPQRPDRQELASLDEASRRMGFAVKPPDPTSLPSGLPAPKIAFMAASQPRFTFSRTQTLSYLQRQGRTDVTIAEKFDGAALVVNMPSGVVLSYGDAKNSSSLIVGQFNQVTAGVEGKVSLDELRDLLLSLPGLPRETADQLRAIQDWRNTLPLPVPADKMQWTETTVAGGPGLVLTDNSGLGSAAIWQRNGHIYGVAGTFKQAEILRVADSYR